MNKSHYKIVAAWTLILLSLMLHHELSGNLLSVNYFPAIPKQNEPIQISVKISNPEPKPKTLALKVYVDGSIIAEWLAQVEGNSIREYRLTKPWTIQAGRSARVHVDAVDVEGGKPYSCSAMIPPFPPEAFSSFTAFAAFSSTLMGYAATMSYYRGVLAEGVNVGLALSLALIGLLIFTELTDPAYGKIGQRITRTRKNLIKEATVLLIVFLAMVVTKIIFIIYGM